jgi:hypothetical protein
MMLEFLKKKPIRLAAIFIALPAVALITLLTILNVSSGRIGFWRDYRGQESNTLLSIPVLLISVLYLILVARKTLREKPSLPKEAYKRPRSFRKRN